MLVELLPRLENTLGINHDAVIQTAAVVAMNGISGGVSALKRLLGGSNVELKPRSFMVAVSGMVQYYGVKDEEQEGCEFLIPVVREYLDERDDLDDSNRAYLYNQISMLQHGAGDYEGSLASLKKALELAPEERSYWYNISVIYESLARICDSCNAAKKLIEEQETPDVDHLAHAIEVFKKAGKRDDARSAIESLERIDPARATFVERRAEEAG